MDGMKQFETLWPTFGGLSSVVTFVQQRRKKAKHPSVGSRANSSRRFGPTSEGLSSVMTFVHQRWKIAEHPSVSSRANSSRRFGPTSGRLSSAATFVQQSWKIAEHPSEERKEQIFLSNFTTEDGLCTRNV